MNFDLAALELENWNEELIEQRSQAIYEIVVTEWPRNASVQ
jgi:hypothetical protein